MSRRRESIQLDSDSRDAGLINPHTAIVTIQNTHVRKEKCAQTTASKIKFHDSSDSFKLNTTM